MNNGLPTLLPIHASGAAVAIGLVAATALFGVRPALEARVDDNRLEGEIEGLLAEEASLRAHVKNGRTQLDQLNAQAATSRVSLDEPDRLATRLRSLSQIAEARGVIIDRLEPGAVRNHDLCAIIGIMMNAQGTPASITGMMHDIAEQRPEVSVRVVRLTASAPSPAATGSSDAGAWVSGRIEFDWYAALSAPSAR